MKVVQELKVPVVRSPGLRKEAHTSPDEDLEGLKRELERLKKEETAWEASLARLKEAKRRADLTSTFNQCVNELGDVDLKVQEFMHEVSAQLDAYPWGEDNKQWGCKFSSPDISSWPLFLKSLKDASTATSPTPQRRIWEMLDQKSREVILSSSPLLPPDEKSKAVLVEGLNTLLQRKDFYKPEVFQGVKLNEETSELLKKLDTLSGDSLGRFNRLAIEAVYPPEIILRGWTIDPIGTFGYYQGDGSGAWTWGRLKDNMDLQRNAAREMLWLLDHVDKLDTKDWAKNYDTASMFEKYKKKDRDIEVKY